MKSSTKIEKQLKGDGLRVNMDLNDLNLKVSGDGCRVTIARNCGSIRVIGDGCSLKVNCNDGDIEYKGDGGSIYLGGGSKTESVSYVGDGGRISVRSDKLKKCGKKKTSNEFKTCCSLSDSELEVKLDNVANENKEAKEKTKVPDQRNNLRRSKTIVVTKISTEHIPVNINNNNNNNNNFIKNLFRSPPSIIRNIKSGPESL